VANVLLFGLAVVAAIYLAYGALLYFGQARHVYMPLREIVATPDTVGLEYETVRFTTSDGVRLAAWWVPPAQPDAPVILFSHGNGGNVSHRVGTLRMLHEIGVGTLMYDYRGYGDSEGTPTEEGTYLDAQAAWRHLTEAMGVPPERIVVHGRSLGGPVAAWLANHESPAALVLESTFTSVPDLAAKLFPLLPARRLSRFSYDTATYVRQVRCPVLVIHGPDDEMVPYSHGRALFDSVRVPKEFLELRGGHNEGYILSERRYMRGLGAFVGRVFAEQGP
jgi:uncharacterized protein